MSAILLLIAFLAAEHIEATEPCAKKLDVLFAVDGSSSICGDTESCPNWDSILQFCKDIVNSLTIGPDDSKVALITVSDGAKLEFNLDEYREKNALSSAIGRVAHNGGELHNLQSAVIFLTHIFKEQYGERLEFPNVEIVITDGIPLVDPEKTDALAKAFAKIGVKVYVVCVRPGCTESLAKIISSEPKQANVTYFFVDNYLSLDDIRDNLMKQICAI